MTTTTWNPSDKSAGTALSGGNLVATWASSGNSGVRSVDRVATGKYYWEITFTTVVSTLIGICTGGTTLTSLNAPTADASILTNGSAFYKGTTQVGTLGGTVTNGWVGCVALDATNGFVWYRNGAAGNWNASATANPATGAGGISLLAWATPGVTGIYACADGGSGGGTVTANFGASAFTGTVPSGFTSGFPDGTSLVLEAVASQIAVEEWSTDFGAVAQVSQIAVEQWSVGSGTIQAVLTQMAVEQWALNPDVVTATGQTAVSVIT